LGREHWAPVGEIPISFRFDLMIREGNTGRQWEISSYMYRRERACEEDDIQIELKDSQIIPGGFVMELEVTCNDGTVITLNVDVYSLPGNGFEVDFVNSDLVDHAIDNLDLPPGCSECKAPLIA
jgi:hypothetical protein